MSLVALLIVFGGPVAALLPLVIAIVAIVATFVVLTIITGFTDVSIFARTLTTALGLGLGINYSLFIVSRCREELHAERATTVAIERTLQTAGRTVIFSASTVAVSLAALFVFAIAGITVVAFTALTAVVVLPTVLSALGPRVDKLRVRKHPQVEHEGLGLWGRQAERVMRHPLPIAIGVTLVLVLFALPFRNVELTRIDDRVLPIDTPARVAADLVREDFSSSQLNAIEILVLDERFNAVDVDRCRESLDGVCGDLGLYARALFEEHLSRRYFNHSEIVLEPSRHDGRKTRKDP